MSDLILSGPRRWDEGLVRHLFYSHDAEEILSLPIQSVGDSGFVAWHFEKNGLFLVKSAYMLALNLKQNEEDEGQYSGAVLGKRKIWDLI